MSREPEIRLDGTPAPRAAISDGGALAIQEAAGQASLARPPMLNGRPVGDDGVLRQQDGSVLAARVGDEER